ncbi:DedA family protein [Thiorhodococcus drewsii]|nr:DedA family protein [Thiorhodococcus drewsii]
MGNRRATPDVFESSKKSVKTPAYSRAAKNGIFPIPSGDSVSNSLDKRRNMLGPTSTAVTSRRINDRIPCNGNPSMLIYLGISFGAMFEGELTLIAAAFAAQRGLMTLHWVFLAALAGTLLADWFYFIMARFFGAERIEKSPVLSSRLHAPKVWLKKHSMLLLLTYRYLYGMRTLFLMMAGLSEIPLRRFLIFSAIATSVWATIFSLIGFYLGEYIPHSLPKDASLFLYVIAGLAILAALVARKRSRRSAQ